MKHIDQNTAEQHDFEASARRIAALEKQAAPLVSPTEKARRAARQHRATLARRITRRNAR